ncbi:hypothetical protein [Parvularcula maris]|uniref:Uncharacterized protein n=1 Tax=Parvularcula maris TaxID=2965077 RepID=A0A9X2L902_9PROT|nr:hypothetical protein [Parvularcula maris]MCQ8185330.1 hypothetical protein [Parvularcula maris]
MVGGIREGALAPLEDLNVRREQIPPLLAELDVYEKPVPSSCTGIEIEIADLESYVGSDIDRVAPVGSTSFRSRMSDIADDQAYRLVSDLTTDFIPFRSMVRRATGASAHDKAVREAYRRGRLRRSYLKGVGFAMGCDSPAAPRFPQTVAERRRLDAEAASVSFEVLEVPPAW